MIIVQTRIEIVFLVGLRYYLPWEIGLVFYFLSLYVIVVFTLSCTITGTTTLWLKHVAQPAGTAQCRIQVAAGVRLGVRFVCYYFPKTLRCATVN